MKIWQKRNANQKYLSLTHESLTTFFKGAGSLLLCLTFITAFNISAHDDEHKEKQNPFFSGVDTAPGRVVQQFHQALQKGDESLAKSLLADDVLIYEGGGIERSAAEYASHHLKADIQYMSGLTVKLLEHQVKESENMAYSTSRSLLSGEYQGKNIKTQTMETILLTKTNGNWLISHIHWSN